MQEGRYAGYLRLTIGRVVVGQVVKRLQHVDHALVGKQHGKGEEEQRPPSEDLVCLGRLPKIATYVLFV